jgi:phospholipase/carboxylesterase
MICNTGYAWYAINFDADENKFSDEQAKVSRDLIARFIDELIEAYPIDANHISLLALRRNIKLRCSTILSEKVQKVVAMSGYLNLKS